MATDNSKLKQLESALIQADAAGDTEGATILAAEIKKIKTSKLTDKELNEMLGLTPKDKIKDFVLGLGTGAAKGVTYIAGLPGDLERLSSYIPYAQNTIGFDYGQPGNDEVIGRSETGRYIFPSSTQIQDYMVQGDIKGKEATKNLLKRIGVNKAPAFLVEPTYRDIFDYKPKTDLGRYAQTGAEFATPGIAGKTKAARNLGLKVGGFGGLTYEGAQDLGASPGAATAITIPLMFGAGLLGKPTTAANLAKDAMENVADKEIKAARELEKIGKDMSINLMPGEVFADKNIRNLTRDVVSSEKGSAITYAAAKNRRDDIIKAVQKQADEIASMPESQRQVFDLIRDTASESVKQAKLNRTITAQNAGYKVANTESLLPEQVFNVIDKIDASIKILPKTSPNIRKLNQIKNQLIAKKVKVKGKKKLEIVPETNINKLDSVFKQFRDDYQRSNKGVANESRFIDKQLGYQLFNETDNAILNTLNKELRTNTNYAQANDKFAKLSEEVIKVVENNVLPLSKKGISETTINSFIFNPNKNNVEDINKTFEILNKTNPEATIQLANVYFRNSINNSFKMTKQGDDLTQGFNLINSIAGTGKQRTNFMAVIDNVAKAKDVNPQQLKVGFDNMIRVLERTGRVANLNNPGFNPKLQAGRTLAKDYAAFYTFNPRVRLATKYGEYKSGKAWEELANVFVKDDSVDALIALSKTNPQSKAAVLRTLYIIDTSQGLQTDPLTEDDERQLYLEELQANQ